MKLIADSISTAGQSVMLSQILITIAISISLKSMWNLMNVMQVLAYSAFYCRWTCNMAMVISQIEQGIKMEVVYEYLLDFG